MTTKTLKLKKGLENRAYHLQLMFFFIVLVFVGQVYGEDKPSPLYWIFSHEEFKTKNRAPQPPFITGDGLRAHADYILDEVYPELDISSIQTTSTIFVATHFLEVFFKLYHPHIKTNYVLVSHNSDEAAPGPFASFLDDEKIIAWFAQNVEGPLHPKLVPIPIGLENRYWPNGADFSLLITMMNQYKDSRRDILLYMNITPRARSDRDKVIQFFKDKSYCKHALGMSYFDYLTDLGRSKFILSPRGNGLDCHRTWEALYMGAIPIVKTSACDEMYKDLPVLIVRDWEDVDEEFLALAQNQLALKKYNLDKIYLDYWLKLIDNANPNRSQTGIDTTSNK
jgi:hypothetical protein